MTPRRIKRGFSRLGLVAAVPLSLMAIVAIGFALFNWATLPAALFEVHAPDPQIFAFPVQVGENDRIVALEKHYGRRLKASELQVVDDGTRRYERVHGALWTGLIFALGAALSYAMLYAIGRVVAGFFDDESPA